MTGWLIETLLWTAVLIAFVLLVRRPVSRHFGPQMAYALWALPAIRLVLPPIELPSWMRLVEAPLASEPVAFANGGILPVNSLPAALSQGVPVEQTAASDELSALTPSTPGVEAGFDVATLVEPALFVWLIGAAVFLILRFSAYFRLRDELLDDAREVGRSGAVRLVETPGAKAPLAFGVIDKVVALPEGFLAHPDRQSRDLALAHELAHHKGRDLLINVLVQPLFAIHWWNPLGRYGWLALRRDQEAACDARVMASAPREQREVYANLIVSFAAGPNIALAAPMACPVLGEKSIVHRLRSLKMDNTNTHRRVAGRLMLGTAVLALPLTASISYAATEVPPAPPAPPEAPSALVAPPAPPAPPLPSKPPVAPLVDDSIIVIDPNGEVSSNAAKGERVFVLEKEEGRRTRFIDRADLRADGQLSEEQIEEILAEVREGLEEANQVLEELPQIIEEAQAEAEVARLEAEAYRSAQHSHVKVEMRCDADSNEIVTTNELSDGSQVISLCQKRVYAQAVEGLREARQSIKKSDDLDRNAKRRALREIDQVILRWENAES